jgi:hypothetical protein
MSESTEEGILQRAFAPGEKADVLTRWVAGKDARVRLSELAGRSGASGALSRASAIFVHQANDLYTILPEWQRGGYKTGPTALAVGGALAAAIEQLEAAKGDAMAEPIARAIVEDISAVADVFRRHGFPVEGDFDFDIPSWFWWAVGTGAAVFLLRTLRG